jgi:hypothetical protein
VKSQASSEASMGRGDKVAFETALELLVSNASDFDKRIADWKLKQCRDAVQGYVARLEEMNQINLTAIDQLQEYCGNANKKIGELNRQLLDAERRGWEAARATQDRPVKGDPATGMRWDRYSTFEEWKLKEDG